MVQSWSALRDKAVADEGIKTIILMSNALYDLKVKDRKSFSQFLELLREDLISNPDAWENKTLPDFLEALATYTEDIQGYYDNTKANINADKPSWSTFADIFKGAKVYE